MLGEVNVLIPRKKPKTETPQNQKRFQTETKEQQTETTCVYARTLSDDSVNKLLRTALDMHCTAIFDVGAGHGRIIRMAKEIGFKWWGGVEKEDPYELRNQQYVKTGCTFAEYIVENGENKLFEKHKTLLYMYEGGIWPEAVCTDAMELVQTLAKPGDVVCVIAPPDDASSVSMMNDTEWKWTEKFKNFTRETYRETKVYGEVCADGQREVQFAYFWTVP